MTVWVYFNTDKRVGDEDHLKIFVSHDAAKIWLQEI